MKKLYISGGRRLNGTIRISGMKNAALPILFACALNQETCVLHDVPQVGDVDTSVAILSAMGVQINYRTPTTLEVNGAGFTPCISPDKLVGEIRASSYLMGVELGRFGRTRIAYPGGCSLGARPLNLHMKGFEALGAEMETSKYLSGSAPDGLRGTRIMLDQPSVGATANMILAATLTPGTTTIINAAREPHIVALAVFLNACGAKIVGAGTTEIRIEGVSSLHGCTHTIIPDNIEAGTYLAAVAGTGGCITLTNVIPKHLESVTAKLTELGVTVEEGEDSITARSDGKLKGASITTTPYPGFPTDMQAQFAPLLAVAEGMSTITEKVSDSRFAYLDELAKTGMTFSKGENIATLPGGQQNLTGCSMNATDLRGGAAMVIAALMADGESDIDKVERIERGYDHMVEKLRSLGATIACREVFNVSTPATVGSLA